MVPFRLRDFIFYFVKKGVVIAVLFVREAAVFVQNVYIFGGHFYIYCTQKCISKSNGTSPVNTNKNTSKTMFLTNSKSVCKIL